MGKTFKLLLAIILSVALLIASASSIFAANSTSNEIISSGSCGEGVSWTLDSTGTLIVSGTGAIEYTGKWDPFAVKRVIIEEGITYICEFAFNWQPYTEEVSIPGSVKSIGVSAFAGSSIKKLVLPEGVEELNQYAFYGCNDLTDIYIPNSLTDFYRFGYDDCLEEIFGGEIPVKRTYYADATSFFSTHFSHKVSLHQHTYKNNTPIITEPTCTEEGITTTRCDNCDHYGVSPHLKALGHSSNFPATCTEAELCTRCEHVISEPLGHDWNEATCIDAKKCVRCQKVQGKPLGHDWNEAETCSICGDLRNPDVIASGTCGYLPWYGAVEWTLNSNGVLALTGASTMASYDEGAAPWCDYVEQIKKIYIEDGITNIGNNAFDGCINVIDIDIPNSVTKIGEGAFARCKKVTHIEVPQNVTKIGDHAFYDCTSLSSITLPDNKLEVGVYAFAYCESLKAICLPEGTTLEGSFYECPAIQITGHLEVTDPAVEVTCVKDGLTKGSHCKACNKIIKAQDVIKATGHTEVIDEGKEATCTEEGIIKKSHCSICNEVLKEEETIPPKGHSWEEEYTVDKEATCTEEGSKSIHCANCDATSDVTVISIAQHIYTDWIEVVEPTLLDDGKERRDCVNCDYYEERATQKIVTSSGTCGSNIEWRYYEGGVLVISGTGSMENYSGSTPAPWYEIKETSGINQVIFDGNITSIGDDAFSYCDNLEEILIPSSVKSIGKYAFSNCISLETVSLSEGIESIGQNAFSGCSNLKEIVLPDGLIYLGNYAFRSCNNLKTITIPDSLTTIGKNVFEYDLSAIERVFYVNKGTYGRDYIETNIVSSYIVNCIKSHDWNSELTIEVAPTCVEKGTGYKKCNACDAIETVTLDKIEHSWNEEYTIDKEATCMEEGFKSIHCANCDATKDVVRIEKAGHEYGKWIIEKESTCAEDGHRYKECICGNIITEILYATGHNYTDTVVIKAPTCLDVGSVGTACSSCGEIDSNSIKELPRIDHSWNKEYTVDKEASCTAEGSKSIHCSACDATKDTVGIEMTSHRYGDWIIDKEPTCTEEGSKHKECSCGNKVTETITSRGHSWGEEYTVDKEASCKAEGSKSIHCSTCDATKDAVIIEKTSHEYGDWAVILNPTVSKEGVQRRSCNNCDYYQESSIGKITFEEFYLDRSRLVMLTGKTAKLTATCIPNTLKVNWSTDNSNIATVGKDGTVTSVGEGQCNIIADIGGYQVTCQVFVKEGEYIGTCGDNAYWVLDEQGILTIFGEGKVNYKAGFSTYDDKITGIIIEEGITSIGKNMFSSNPGQLKGSLVLPESLQEIESGAFAYCYGFTGNLIIPDNVTYIGSGAFGDCSGFTGDLILSKNLQTIEQDAFRNCSGFTGDLIIPDSVTEIGSAAFYGCVSFTGKLILSKNLHTIASEAFSCCSGLTDHLIVPEGIVSIGDQAFYKCKGLEGEIVIPESVTYIGKFAFDSCENLQEERIIIENDNCTIYDYKDTFSQNTLVGYYDSTTYKYAKKYSLNFACIEHSWEEEYTVDKEASCTAEGSKSIHCANCDATKDAVVIEKMAHEYGDWIIDEEATCTADGSKHKECANCDATESGTIPSSGHSWNEDFTVDKEATCKEEGSKSIHCADCTTTKDATVIKNLAHAYGDWIIDEEATCTADGSKHKECANCDATESGTIPSSGHSWNEDFTVDKEATCKEEGSKSIHCSKCTATKDETVIEKLDHAYGDWITTKEATCTEVGSKYKKCTCGDTITEEIPVTEHPWNEQFTVDKDASCTEEGFKSVHCSACTATKDETAIEKLDHAHGDWITTKAATCTEVGSKYKKCTCGDTVTEEIPATEHPWKEQFTVDKEASCTEEGFKSIHCSACTATKDETVVEKVSHAFGDWITDTEASCTADGSKHKECANCDVTESTTITSFGHSWNKDFTVDKEASCTEEGSESIHCSKCNAAKDVRVIEKTAHAYGNDSICDVCGFENETLKPAPTPTPTPGTGESGGTTPEPTPTPEPEEIPTPESTPTPEVHQCSYDVIKTPATIAGDGNIVSICTGCGDYKSEPIYRISAVTLTKKSATYNSKVKSPKVVVKDSNGSILKLGADYTVTTPKGRKNVGKYIYTVKFKGDYSGKKKLTLSIKPKAPIITTPKAAKKAVTVKWKKGKKAQVTGYQIMTATNSKFTKNAKTTTVKGYSKTSAKVSKLKAKTKYFVKVRTYKTVKGVKIYSDWSKVKIIRTK